MFTAEHVRNSLARLRADSAPVFGSQAHKFLLNDPLSDSEVRAFEHRHGIHLPPDYRFFISSIGNGGAGPFYGVFPLGMMDENFGLQSWEKQDGIIGTLTSPFPHRTAWNDLAGQPSEELLTLNEAEYDSKVDEFETRYWSPSLVDGAIPICHTGCALRIWLVVAGEQFGHVWYDGRADYSGIVPLVLNDGSPLTFSTWYEDWLTRLCTNLKSL